MPHLSRDDLGNPGTGNAGNPCDTEVRDEHVF